MLALMNFATYWANGNIGRIGRTRLLQHLPKVSARDRRREKENPFRIRPIPKCASAHQQHFPQKYQASHDAGTHTLHHKKEEGKRDYRGSKKRTAGTISQTKRMHQQKRVHPIDRTDQTCSYRRAEQIHPSRIPASARNGEGNGLCQARGNGFTGRHFERD